MGLLEKVNYPEDIRNFSMEDLKMLCAEIRSYMIESCSTNPGHLGSSLGAVELIVGLHYVYNTPKDNIIFDVGHQAYAHKIITGRKEAFKKNRKLGGISGFPKISESKYDVFGAGHTSTSISAGLGIAMAAKLLNKQEKTVSIIGDGSLTGGLAFEGLNNAGNSDANLLVILNDNNISIDKNIGAMHEYLLKITTDPTYNEVKKKIWDHLGEGKVRSFVQNITRDAKTNIVNRSGGGLFEILGFRYFGPIDGNDIEQVVETLKKIKDLSGPIFLHTLTTKGKGFTPAEEDQTTWHAPGYFDPKTGKRISAKDTGVSRYQDVFGEVLLELAKMDEKVVGITPAMASGCGMNLLAHEIPSRFFDVGIEEGHAVTFSAGLAAGGMKPFCNIYSSFSQRAYDQIIHDVATQKLNVTLCFDRSGLVGEDGATHQGNFDMAAYRSIPNCIIGIPSNEIELKNMMYTATQNQNGPFIIRYPRGFAEGLDWRNENFKEIEIGKSSCLRKGEKIAIVCAGPFVYRALEASNEFERNFGFSPSIYNLKFLKPFDEELMLEVLRSHSTIITVEDGCIKGGLFGEMCEFSAKHEISCKIKCVGIEDEFVEQGSQSEQRSTYGLDLHGLYKILVAESKKSIEKS